MRKEQSEALQSPFPENPAYWLVCCGHNVYQWTHGEYAVFQHERESEARMAIPTREWSITDPVAAVDRVAIWRLTDWVREVHRVQGLEPYQAAV